MAERKFQNTGRITLPGKQPHSFVYIATSAEKPIGAVTTDDQKIYMFDYEAGKITSNFSAHSASITGIAMNDKSQILATCCTEGPHGAGNELMLWDIRTNQNIATFYPDAYSPEAKLIECCAISCDGCIYGCGTNFGVFTWDVRQPDGHHEHINIQSDTIASLQFHPFVPSTFVSGDDDGNLLVWDLDADENEDGTQENVIVAVNDGEPVYQCGFCGSMLLFTLRRVGGMCIWDMSNSENRASFDDIRPLVGDSFNYPINIHWAGDNVMVTGGDSDGGVAVCLCSEQGCTLFQKIEKANKDCVNSSDLAIKSNGDMHLFLAGDMGDLSFWTLRGDSN